MILILLLIYVNVDGFFFYILVIKYKIYENIEVKNLIRKVLWEFDVNEK